MFGVDGSFVVETIQVKEAVDEKKDEFILHAVFHRLCLTNRLGIRDENFPIPFLITERQNVRRLVLEPPDLIEPTHLAITDKGEGDFPLDRRWSLTFKRLENFFDPDVAHPRPARERAVIYVDGDHTS